MQLLKVLCALDVSDLNDALRIVKRLGPHVGGFKIGHSLTLHHGLSVIDVLREAGAKRIFLDLKFHDIPNTVALAVREASKYGVWMMTLHAAGGPAMMTAATEEAQAAGLEQAPLLVGVCVLTSLDETILNRHLGVQRSMLEQMEALCQSSMDCGLDGIVCPPPYLKEMRPLVGHESVLVSPGIRIAQTDQQDQKQIGTAAQALADGADYLVIGRTLIESPDPEEALRQLGFSVAPR